MTTSTLRRMNGTDGDAAVASEVISALQEGQEFESIRRKNGGMCARGFVRPEVCSFGTEETHLSGYSELSATLVGCRKPVLLSPLAYSRS